MKGRPRKEPALGWRSEKGEAGASPEAAQPKAASWSSADLRLTV